jgi:hypothetical protein
MEIDLDPRPIGEAHITPTNVWRGPMLRRKELIFAVVIVNVSTARSRFFVGLRL